jgi:predicted nucleic acid-binding protein
MTALAAERPLVYADSSALVKLVIEEQESEALAAHIEKARPVLATSRVALVEVVRAVGLANPSTEAREEAVRAVESCLLVDVTDVLLRSAAALASLTVRTLDAIHLASAQRVGADEMLVYDARLREAAASAGLATAAPGR